MLLWLILSGLSLLTICLYALFTYTAPKIATKSHVTDAPESTPPPALSIDEYPLQLWQVDSEPSAVPTRR
jgi:hypothetical protein